MPIAYDTYIQRPVEVDEYPEDYEEVREKVVTNESLDLEARVQASLELALWCIKNGRSEANYHTIFVLANGPQLGTPKARHMMLHAKMLLMTASSGDFQQGMQDKLEKNVPEEIIATFGPWMQYIRQALKEDELDNGTLEYVILSEIAATRTTVRLLGFSELVWGVSEQSIQSLNNMMVTLERICQDPDVYIQRLSPRTFAKAQACLNMAERFIQYSQAHNAYWAL